LPSPQRIEGFGADIAVDGEGGAVVMSSNLRSPPPPRSSTTGGYPAAKRARHASPDQTGKIAVSPKSAEDGDVPTGKEGKAGQSSSFRNVSACNRCRLRKNRCDQRLPSCASCEKASVKCVGYDPITKREIPRRWVYLISPEIKWCLVAIVVPVNWAR
jgi:hypothetical protein